MLSIGDAVIAAAVSGGTALVVARINSTTTARQSHAAADAQVKAAEIRSADDQELRVNERLRHLLDGYERRIADLESQYSALMTMFSKEQEDRRMAEITAETAHMRADELEIALGTAKQELLAAKEIEARLIGQNETLKLRIVALEARVHELEDQLTQYRRDRS